MSQSTPTRQFTILLLRESYESPEQALRKSKTLNQVSLKQSLPFCGELWYSKTTPRPPRWQDLVNSILQTPINLVYSSSPSAVLFIWSSNRIFAFTFGHGRYLLKPDCYEPRFGLKVVLNRVSPDRLRSLDMRTYEDIVVTTRKQTSRSTQLSSFGLNVSRDLLRAVTGEPNDESFAKRISGADSLTISVSIAIEELEQKCSEILNAYRDAAYKQHFEWVDNLAEARKPVVDILNDKLVDYLMAGKTEKLHLAPPDVLDWQSVEKFCIGGTGRTEYDDLDINEYLKALGKKRDDLSLPKLKSYQVSIREAGSNRFIRRWSLYDCIVAEAEHEGRLYALSEGKWFEIDRSFAERVYSFVSSLPTPRLRLPPAYENEKEADYNQRAASEGKGLLCLDGFLIRPQDATHSIEFCDLLSLNKQLIYVKRRTRSATLSHLFSQATVAVQAFSQDGALRQRIREELANRNTQFLKILPEKDERPSPSAYEVVYAIITKKSTNWPGALPFFSRLNLMQHAKVLQGFGFRVSLTKIDEYGE